MHVKSEVYTTSDIIIGFELPSVTTTDSMGICRQVNFVNDKLYLSILL